MLLSVLGDSLTQGFPFGEKVSWLETLTEKLGIKTRNHGICGETTADMVLRLPCVLTESNLTHLLIFGGANDLLLECRSLESIIHDMLMMQEFSLEKGIKTGCILPLIPNIQMYEQEFTQLREQLVTKSLPGIFLVDFQPSFKKGQNSINYLGDGVHLTIEGNKNIGEYAAAVLKNWLV